MNTKTQKEVKKEVIKAGVLKGLHIVGYVSIGILAVLGIAMGVQSCNGKKEQPKQDNLVRVSRKDVLRENQVDDLSLTSWVINKPSEFDIGNPTSNSAVQIDYVNYTIWFTYQDNDITYNGNIISINHTRVDSGNNYTLNNGLFFYSNSSSDYPYYRTMHYYSSANADYTSQLVKFNSFINWTNYGDLEVNINFGYASEGTSNSELIEWLYSNATLVSGGESESESTSTQSESEQQESYNIYLNGYDYRSWFGNVDNETGCIRYEISTATYQTYGGVDWLNIGNGRKYNFVSFVIQPIEDDDLFIATKIERDDESATTGYTYYGYTAVELYGADYNKYSYVSRIYYGYKEGYEGGTMESGTWDYRDTIYEMPFVSCWNTQSYVLGIYPNNYTFPYLYRGMQILHDYNYKNDVPRYSQTSIVELWKMETNNYIGVVPVGNGDINAFSLLTKAFNSISNVLSIQIFPNISLGVFLFIPLVVGIIFAVIKIIKK